MGANPADGMDRLAVARQQDGLTIDVHRPKGSVRKIVQRGDLVFGHRWVLPVCQD
jgi:hypothetical protein